MEMPKRRNERAGRVACNGYHAALIECGVCPSWCEFLARGPSTSISRYVLWTRGVRRDHVGCKAERVDTCSRYRRQLPR